MFFWLLLKNTLFDDSGDEEFAFLGVILGNELQTAERIEPTGKGNAPVRRTKCRAGDNNRILAVQPSVDFMGISDYRRDENRLVLSGTKAFSDVTSSS